MEVRLLKDVLRQMTGLLYRQRMQLEVLQRSSGDTVGPSTPRVAHPRPWPPTTLQQPTTSSPAPGVPVGWSVDEGLLRGGGSGQWGAEPNPSTQAPRSLGGDFFPTGGPSMLFSRGSSGNPQGDHGVGHARPPAVRAREEFATSMPRKSQRRDVLLSLLNQMPSTASCPVPITVDQSRSSQGAAVPREAVLVSRQSRVPVGGDKAMVETGEKVGGNDQGGSEECDQQSGGADGTMSSEPARSVPT